MFQVLTELNDCVSGPFTELNDCVSGPYRVK